ncbi:STAS domain-containing protein [Nocardioides dilutus]
MVLDLHRTGLHQLDEVQRQVDLLLEGGPRTLVVDLSALHGAMHTSSSTIAALMCVRERASARGVDVALRAPDRRLTDTLHRSGLLGMLATKPQPQVAPDEHEGLREADSAPEVGVTRLDLVCGPDVARTAQELTRRWARDRALPAASVSRLGALVLAAITHGLRFDPRSVTIAVRWVDLDRVRVDVRWKGCSATARPAGASGDLESTTGTLDALAEDWGFSTNAWGPVQWMVLDTR